jgi:hypothetical protein
MLTFAATMILCQYCMYWSFVYALVRELLDIDQQIELILIAQGCSYGAFGPALLDEGIGCTSPAWKVPGGSNFGGAGTCMYCISILL